MFIKSFLRTGSLLARRPAAESLSKRFMGIEARVGPEFLAVCEKAEKENNGPERDHVNWPRVEYPMMPSPVRMHFVPQSWFDILYDKQGVTGPYILGFGSLLFCISKELWVVEHEFAHGVTLIATWGWLVHKLWPMLKEYCEKGVEADIVEIDNHRDIPLNAAKENITNIEEAIDSAKHTHLIFEAKKENVGLQLEEAYRQRLLEAHRQVKQKLDYHLQTDSVRQNFEQKHMVDWIVKNVRSSITPAAEAAALKQCMADLKSLAARA